MPKAAVVHDFKAPLTIEERPIPTPDESQVLVRLEASGLCHTDIHAAHGDWLCVKVSSTPAMASTAPTPSTPRALLATW
jgi:D-arabinose 1-dehydrogenase-like Zn-dependent alcohol dehydrogenase